MMEHDLSHDIVDDKGEPLKDQTGATVGLKTVVQQALLTPTSTDTPASKMEKYELYLKLKLSALKADLSTEEANLIKEAASSYPVLFYGQIVHWLQGKLHKDQPK